MDAGHTAMLRGLFLWSGVGERDGGGRGGGEEADPTGGAHGAPEGDDAGPHRYAGSQGSVSVSGGALLSEGAHGGVVRPHSGEVPTRDILIAALQDGKIVCYPLSHVHGRILSFRAIKSESELEPGRLGVREPTNSADLIAVDQIDLFVVPGLGFTREGKRLGRGGGYYDATLRAASQRSRRVGLAFNDQVVPVLPTTGDDVDMDLVVTESESLRGLYRDWDFLDT